MIRHEPVASLLLDEANPRFPVPVDGQDAAITEILLDAPSKMLNLARDIAEQGSVNPTELPVAVEEDGTLVVIEGNRRLAALKLLADPELARDASEQVALDLVKRLRESAALGVGPQQLDVYVAADRDAAKHWIDLRHTGENEGVGVLGWAAWQANNFRRRRGTQADRATIFCSAVEAEFPDDKELRALVAQVRKERLTTLGRLIADPDVRREFGFDFDDDGVVFYFPHDDLDRGLRRVFRDLADSITVTDIKTKKQRATYVAEREDELPSRANRSAQGRTPGSSNSATPPPPDSTKQSDGPKPKPKAKAQPEKVIFQGLKLPHCNPRISSLLASAQKIDIDSSPQVAAILIRILLELVITDAIDKSVVKGAESDSLKVKCKNALLSLDSNCENPVKRDKSLTMAWTRTQDNDGMAVQSLHAFVHNIYGDPTPSEVRTLSATFRPVVERIDLAMGLPSL